MAGRPWAATLDRCSFFTHSRSRRRFMDRRSAYQAHRHRGRAGGRGLPPAVHAQAAVRWRLASSFPQVAGHDLRRRRGEILGDRQGNVGRQVRDIGARRRRVDARLRRGRRAGRTTPSRWPHRALLLRWQGPAFSPSAAVPFGLHARRCTRGSCHGNGGKLMDEFYGRYNFRTAALQHRHPDGRLVSARRSSPTPTSRA
jgi:hypothetical protein